MRVAPATRPVRQQAIYTTFGADSLVRSVMRCLPGVAYGRAIANSRCAVKPLTSPARLPCTGHGDPKDENQGLPIRFTTHRPND